jgi:hypothetical protein
VSDGDHVVDPNPYAAPHHGQEREPILEIDDSQPTTLSYELTLEDYVTLYVIHRLRSRSHVWIRRIVFVLAWCCVPLGIAAYFAGWLWMRPDPEKRFFLIFMAVAYSVIFPLTYPLIRRSSLQKESRSRFTRAIWRSVLARKLNDNFLGSHTLTIAPDKLYLRGPKSEVSFNLSGVTQLVLSQELLMIYISPMNAYLVPRRAFRSEEEVLITASKLERWTGRTVEHVDA